MRRLQPPIAAGRRSRLDRVEPPFAGVEIGDHAAPAAKSVFDRRRRLRDGHNAFRVGLPGLQQHILDRAAGAVDDQPSIRIRSPLAFGPAMSQPSSWS
jgi:hypothetical protein